MNKYFVISDTHFNHKNIIEYCDRPFNSVEEMNKAIIDNWNAVVDDQDTVFHLGDFALGKADEVKDLVSKLNGHKILVIGNHDHMTKTAYLDAGFEVVYKEEMIIKFPQYDKPLLFSHHPKATSNYLNIYGHMHDKNNDTPNSVCACVEVIDYTPIELGVLLERHANEFHAE